MWASNTPYWVLVIGRVAGPYPPIAAAFGGQQRDTSHGDVYAASPAGDTRDQQARNASSQSRDIEVDQQPRRPSGQVKVVST
jgi:hypothetical protein